MHTLARAPLLAAPLLLALACDPAVSDPTELDDVDFRCTTPTCGINMNTPFTGALGISPLDTLGHTVEDIRVDAVVLPGVGTLDKFWAYHGQLFGKKGELVYSGSSFFGADFRLIAGGVPLSLKVAAVDPPTAPEVFWLYLFEWDEGGGGTDPVCMPANGDLRAVVHENLVIDPSTGVASARPNTVYIACKRGAAGEIALQDLGYGFRPWELGLDAFTGAMRMLRADYCGDGKAWTEFGQPLTYSDKWNIGAGFQGHTDAAWGLNGALCIGGESLRAGFTYDDIECASGPKPPMCDDAEAKQYYITQGRFWTGIP